MRTAKNKKERLTAAKNSKDDDLFEDNGMVIVFGKNLEGEEIYLGEVSLCCLTQKSIFDRRAMIEQVRFGA
jgi:hypothetical protein